mgnify:CR=1 FL=1
MSNLWGWNWKTTLQGYTERWRNLALPFQTRPLGYPKYREPCIIKSEERGGGRLGIVASIKSAKKKGWIQKMSPVNQDTFTYCIEICVVCDHDYHQSDWWRECGGHSIQNLCTKIEIIFGNNNTRNVFWKNVRISAISDGNRSRNRYVWGSRQNHLTIAVVARWFCRLPHTQRSQVKVHRKQELARFLL